MLNIININDILKIENILLLYLILYNIIVPIYYLIVNY